MQQKNYITGNALPQDIPSDSFLNKSKIAYSQKEYHTPSKTDVLDDFLTVERSKAFNTLIKSFSPRQYNRLCSCGHYFFSFSTISPNTSPSLIRSGCHSDLCVRCKKHDSRKQNRVVNNIGLSLIDYCVWIKVIITIPIEYRDSHFTNYDAIDTFINKSWDILKKEYDIWHGLDRLDKGAGIFTMHWMGDIESHYNPHLEVMIPAIRYGLPFEPKQDKDQFKLRKHRLRRKIAKVLSAITGENIGIERTNARILFKRDRKSKVHAIKYQVRSTIKLDKLMELSDSAKTFLIDGRWNKKSIRYKGKLGNSTETKLWYERLNLDYHNRNGKKEDNTWLDSEGNPYKYDGKMTKALSLQNEGLKLQKLSHNLYCFKDQEIISNKSSEMIFNALKVNHKIAKSACTYLKKSLDHEFKIDWSPQVIEFAKEVKFYQLLDPELATGKSKREWKNFQITPVMKT